MNAEEIKKINPFRFSAQNQTSTYMIKKLQSSLNMQLVTTGRSVLTANKLVIEKSI